MVKFVHCTMYAIIHMIWWRRQKQSQCDLLTQNAIIMFCNHKIYNSVFILFHFIKNSIVSLYHTLWQCNEADRSSFVLSVIKANKSSSSSKHKALVRLLQFRKMENGKCVKRLLHLYISLFRYFVLKFTVFQKISRIEFAFIHMFTQSANIRNSHKERKKSCKKKTFD